jgi:hypothetical protein
MLTMAMGATAGVACRINQVDGAIISAGSKDLIDAIIELCRVDKSVRLYLSALATQSVYAGVIMAALAIIVPILANHGLIPPLFAPPTSQPTGIPVMPPQNGVQNGG